MAVEVWLGNEPRYPSEKETIIKLAEELNMLDEFYIIMANVYLKKEYDAIVLSSNKIINLEIKEFSGPFETKVNGPWYFLDTKKEYLPNPFDELQKRYYTLKNWLQKHSHQLVQAPNQQKVFKDIKNIICVVPQIHLSASNLNEKPQWPVRIVGLNDLAGVVRSSVSKGLNLSPEALREIPKLLNLKKIDWRTSLSLAQSEPSEKIKRALIPFPVAQYTQHFVGRAFLDEALDRFLSSHDKGYWILKGEPGIGKTSWAAHLVATRDYVHHFFDRTQGIIRAEQAIKNIAAQLIHKHGLVDLEPFLDHPEPSALLSEVLSRVSEKITPLSKKEIIVIDALDEAESPSQTGSINVMQLPASLPPGVFVVATTRPTEDKRLYVVADPYVELTLASDDPANHHDIATFIRQCLDEKLKARIERTYQSVEKFIAAVLERSEGNFMYVVRLIDDIRNNRITNLGQLPVGLQGYYKGNLRRLENQSNPQEWRFLHKPVLGILSVVAEPITSSQLAAWLKLPQADVEYSLEHCREVLEKNEADQLALWSIYDKRFQEFLQREFDQKHFHEIIVDYYRDQCSGQWHHLSERYALKHLARHMRLSGHYADLVSFISRDMRERKLHILGTDLSFKQDLEEAFQAAAELGPTKLADLFKFHLMLENLTKGPNIPVEALEAMVLLGQQDKAREYALLQHDAYGLARIAGALLTRGKKEEAIRQGKEALQMLKSKKNSLCELSSTAAYLELVCTFSSVAPSIAEETFEELLRLLSKSEEHCQWWNIDNLVEELQEYMPRLLQSAPQNTKRLVLESFDKSSFASASVALLVSYIEHSARHDPSSAVKVARRAYAWVQKKIIPQISSQEWRVHPPEHYLVMMARALLRVGLQSEAESIITRLGPEWEAQLKEIALLESAPEKYKDKLYELRRTPPSRKALPLDHNIVDLPHNVPNEEGIIENARHASAIEEYEEKLVDFVKRLISQGEIAQALNIMPHLCPYLRIPVLIEAAKYLAMSNPDESRRLIHQVRALARDAYSLHWHEQFHDIVECRAYAARELASIDPHVARELVEMVVSSPSYYSHPELEELPIGQPGFEPVFLERSSEIRRSVEIIREYSPDPYKDLLVGLIKEIAKDGNIQLAFDLMELDPEYRRAYFAVLAERAHTDPQRALAAFEEKLRVARDEYYIEYILGYMVDGALYDEVLDWMQRTQLRSSRIIDRILTQLLAKKDFAKAEHVLEFLNIFDTSKKEEWMRRIEQAKLPPQKHYFTHQQITALMNDTKKFVDFMETDRCYEFLDFLIKAGRRQEARQIFQIMKIQPLYARLSEGEPVEDELLEVGERMAELGLNEDLRDLCTKVLIFLTAEQGYDWIHRNTDGVVNRLYRLIEAVPAKQAYPMIIAVLKEAGVATTVMLIPAIRKLRGSYLLRQVFDVVREHTQYRYW